MTTIEIIKTLRTLEQQEKKGSTCAGYEIDYVLETLDQEQPDLSNAMCQVMDKNRYEIEYSMALAIAAMQEAKSKLGQDA